MPGNKHEGPERIHRIKWLTEGLNEKRMVLKRRNKPNMEIIVQQLKSQLKAHLADNQERGEEATKKLAALLVARHLCSTEPILKMLTQRKKYEELIAEALFEEKKSITREKSKVHENIAKLRQIPTPNKIARMLSIDEEKVIAWMQKGNDLLARLELQTQDRGKQ